jgi:SAM-dependent methyltransferase
LPANRIQTNILVGLWTIGEHNMATTAEFQPRRFRSAAAHYRTGRPDYAPLLIRRVAWLCGLLPESRVLDLGCGPGLLAVAFAPLVAEVVAMDPEPEMLARVAEQAVASVTLRLGSSYDLGAVLGRFRLTTMGRSFHWMDRADTLQRLDELIEPGGAVALFDTSHPELPDNAWAAEFRELRGRYGDDEPSSVRRRPPAWVRHEAMLLDSPFCHLEVAAVIERRQVPAESLVDRALSMSGTSPGRLGDRVEAFTREITALATSRATDGMLTEVIESRAVVAFRPGEQPE